MEMTNFIQELVPDIKTCRARKLRKEPFLRNVVEIGNQAGEELIGTSSNRTGLN